MIPLYLKTIYKGINNFKKTSTLYTVHNLGYQGVFDASALPYTGLGRDYFTLEGLEFYGKLNLMKSGLIYSSLISTVSNTYAKEILEPENGFGLDGVLRKRKGDLFGIINGIDYNEWDPGKDMFLTSRYTFRDLKGKIKCRETLLNKAKLNDEKLPLIGMISRLSVQKGLDLVLGSVEELMDMGVNIIVLGKGEDNYQNFFVKASKKYKGRFFTDIGFEESLAHLIYAGCDFFLMPSKYEPCGLGQLIAMRYGTIPIARKTGGLADTIQDYNHLLSEGSGYLFNDFTASAMQDAVKRALCVFTDKRKMRKMVHDVMNADFSWEVSADKYLDLYKKCVKKVIK
jgi:starch synthase